MRIIVGFVAGGILLGVAILVVCACMMSSRISREVGDAAAEAAGKGERRWTR